MNLAHIINQYIESLGWKGLAVTESVDTVEMRCNWIVYANKNRIGEFQTAIHHDSPIMRSFVANTAIHMLADYETKNGRVLK